MKKLLLIFIFSLLLFPLQAQTQPNWLQIKDTPFIDIRKSGAVSGDGTDLSVFMNAQIALGNRSFYVPPGAWTISNVVTVPNGYSFNLYGVGDNSSIDVQDLDGPMIAGNKADVTAISGTISINLPAGLESASGSGWSATFIQGTGSCWSIPIIGTTYATGTISLKTEAASSCTIASNHNSMSIVWY